MAGGLLVSLLASYSFVQYYAQAICGHLAIVMGARPIDDCLKDPSVEVDLKVRLAKIKQIRDFAVHELGLPDNDSYRTYVDIGRPYVAWNVIATTQLSLQPVEWCFPIAGCVNYRGYYNKADAVSYARTLQKAGYDVHVSEVPAYSTLGWFNDPVLSSFVNYAEPQLARLIFHELAHQVLYAKGDSQFNESFAVTVAEEGVQRWIAKFGAAGVQKKLTAYEKRKTEFLTLLTKYRERLADLYTSEKSTSEKRARKLQILHGLKDEFGTLKVSWGGYSGYDDWFAQPLNNAHLASIATYHDFVPGFKALLHKQPNLQAFYVTARSLAALPKPLRDEQLTQLGESDPLTNPLKGGKNGGANPLHSKKAVS
ncbi:aminopeptidase [Noviherbaspirillum sp. Root189]|nr:aminopeptidase [Noviherbaspirillum sp. Root189]